MLCLNSCLENPNLPRQDQYPSTEHFESHLPMELYTPAEIDSVLAFHERTLARLEAEFGQEFYGSKIGLYADLLLDAGAVTLSTEFTDQLRISLGSTYLDMAVGHEVVHAYFDRLGMDVNNGVFSEGAAEAFSFPLDSVVPYLCSRFGGSTQLEIRMLIFRKQFALTYESPNFHQLDYPMSGFFMLFLQQKLGRSKLIQIYKAMNANENPFEVMSSFGYDLYTLIDEFDKSVNNITAECHL